MDQRSAVIQALAGQDDSAQGAAEAAAVRIRRSVMQRQEGFPTRFLDAAGQSLYNAALAPKHLTDAVFDNPGLPPSQNVHMTDMVPGVALNAMMMGGPKRAPVRQELPALELTPAMEMPAPQAMPRAAPAEMPPGYQSQWPFPAERQVRAANEKPALDLTAEMEAPSRFSPATRTAELKRIPLSEVPPNIREILLRSGLNDKGLPVPLAGSDPRLNKVVELLAGQRQPRHIDPEHGSYANSGRLADLEDAAMRGKLPPGVKWRAPEPDGGILANLSRWWNGK